MLAPAKSLEEMRRVIRNDYVDATLGLVAAVVVVLVMIFAFASCIKAMGKPERTVLEVGGPGAPEASGA